MSIATPVDEQVLARLRRVLEEEVRTRLALKMAEATLVEERRQAMRRRYVDEGTMSEVDFTLTMRHEFEAEVETDQTLLALRREHEQARIELILAVGTVSENALAQLLWHVMR